MNYVKEGERPDMTTTYTTKKPEIVRIISFRKANKRKPVLIDYKKTVNQKNHSKKHINHVYCALYEWAEAKRKREALLKLNLTKSILPILTPLERMFQKRKRCFKHRISMGTDNFWGNVNHGAIEKIFI